MRIYLDNCCFNRPYDSQDSFRVSMETRAKLHIQNEIINGKYEMVCSYMLEYENSQNPDLMKRDRIKDFQDNHLAYYVPLDRREELQEKVAKIMESHIAYKDATHLACAIFAGCEYLLTTDIRLQKRYRDNEIRVLNPLEFIQLEEEGSI